MARSTKSYEERMLQLEKREQESLEKAKQYAAQKRELEKRKKAEESKKRTHRLCQIGGAVESVLGCPIEEEDLPKLIGFLKKQEANGNGLNYIGVELNTFLNDQREFWCEKEESEEKCKISNCLGCKHNTIYLNDSGYTL